MIGEKIKIRVSSFVSLIVENDAQAFGFVKKGGSTNRNGFLTKLIPNLLELRKYRREKIRGIIKTNLSNKYSESIFYAINTVIDEVYFSDMELETLDDEIWVRPSKASQTSFDEIADSESRITGLEVSVYIRSLLNEYARLPQYEREKITFDQEMSDIAIACEKAQILHFRQQGQTFRIFAYHYVYGFLHDQTIYCIGYDLDKKQIRSFAVHNMRDTYTIKTKYKPTETLINALQEYLENCDYEKIVSIGEDERDVF